MLKAASRQRFRALLSWAAHLLGWYVAVFPGVGRDQSNIPFLIGGTLLILLTLPFVLARSVKR
jgi:hypothetical protein